MKKSKEMEGGKYIREDKDGPDERQLRDVREKRVDEIDNRKRLE